MSPVASVRGVTIDFYMTLVRHALGQGRGACLMRYLAENRLTSAPWEHQVLYDVFDFYGEAYEPEARPVVHREFWTEFTRRLFVRLDVSGPGSDRPAAHAEAVRRLLGPTSLSVFEDAIPALEELRRRGLRVGIVSNWQRGLAHFCRELGLLGHVDFVIASAEVGCAKPDRRIFEEAIRRMRLPARQLCHVGDHPVEDVQGALAAGIRPVLLARDGETRIPDTRVLSTLRALPMLVRSGA